MSVVMPLGQARKSRLSGVPESEEGGEEFRGKEMKKCEGKREEEMERGGEEEIQTLAGSRVSAPEASMAGSTKSKEMKSSGPPQNDGARLIRDARFRQVEPIFLHTNQLNEEEESVATRNWMEHNEFRCFHLNVLRQLEEAEASRPFNEPGARQAAYLSAQLRHAFTRASNIRPSWVFNSEREQRIVQVRRLQPSLNRWRPHTFPPVKVLETQFKPSKPITDRMETEYEEKPDPFYPSSDTVQPASTSKVVPMEGQESKMEKPAPVEDKRAEPMVEKPALGVDQSAQSQQAQQVPQAQQQQVPQDVGSDALPSQPVQQSSDVPPTIFESELAPSGRSGPLNVRHAVAGPLAPEVAEDPAKKVPIPISSTSSKSQKKAQVAHKPAGHR
jgi:hypothetical protein